MGFCFMVGCSRGDSNTFIEYLDGFSDIKENLIVVDGAQRVERKRSVFHGVPQNFRQPQREILMDLKQPLKCIWLSGFSLASPSFDFAGKKLLRYNKNKNQNCISLEFSLQSSVRIID